MLNCVYYLILTFKKIKKKLKIYRFFDIYIIIRLFDKKKYFLNIK